MTIQKDFPENNLSFSDPNADSPEYLESLYRDYQEQANYDPLTSEEVSLAKESVNEESSKANGTEHNVSLQSIQEILQSFGANTENLTKPLDLCSWTRWGAKNRYAAKLIQGAYGDEGVVFKDFKSSEKPKLAFFKDKLALSPQELELRKEATEKAYSQAATEIKRRQEEVAAFAPKLWEQCQEVGSSEYLSLKKVQAYGLRYGRDCYGDFIAIPLLDSQGRLWNIQKIYKPQPKGLNNKWFLTGGRKKGCFYTIGKPLEPKERNEPVLVCEGYATGASLHAATGYSVVIAFDAGNLEPVIKDIKAQFPRLSLLIAGDDDRWGTESDNLGRTKALEAANQYGCDVVFPCFQSEHHPQKPTDFNDLHCLEGVAEVKRQIEAVSNKESKISLKQEVNPEWEDPLPLKGELLPVEPLPLDIIPDPLQPWLQDIAHRMQCPIEHVAVPSLIMVGSIIGAACAIRPKRNDSWQIIPNLWGGIIGLPSTLKSPALAEVIKPLAHLEKKARQRFEEKQEEHAYNLEAHKIEKEAKISKMKSDMKANKIPFCSEAIKDELKELAEPKEPLCERFKTNDATIEKMTELLEENPRGLLLLRDELIGLLTTWSKQGRESDRAFYLEAWNGYGSHTTDRIERGTTHCDNMCVSILGATQPSKILSYLYKAIHGIENDGLVQRFQLLVYPDEQKVWELVDESSNKDAQEKVFKLIEEIALMDFTQKGAIQENENDIPYFRFSEKAQELFYQWLTDLETTKLRGSEDSVIVEHLAKYRKLMPALALIIHVIDIASGKPLGPISVEAAAKAAAWCDFLELHARRIYNMATNIIISAATVLVKKIKNHELKDGFTARDVYRKQWSLLANKEVAGDVCEELVKLRFLKEKITEPAFGQKGKVEYFINPKIWRQS